MKICSVTGCSSKHRGKGYCDFHYHRWYNGIPLDSPRETHGMSRSREYMVWKLMIQRCDNKNNPAYNYYGGRGIKVCQRWYKFENFYQDTGKRPDGMTLDRKNVDGNYEPGNCRWATKVQQSINTRIRSNNTSGYRGVARTKNRKKWRAYITMMQKRYSLGEYRTKEEAAKVYDKHAIELHGEFARLNFPGVTNAIS